MSVTEVESRGRTFCRGCNSKNLFSGLDLGELPIANELWSSASTSVEIFPLHLRICAECGLGQVEDVVTPSRLFKDYRYLSSTSSSFLENAKKFSSEVGKKLKLTNQDWVLEIASNDGYLLRNFVELGIPVLGIEPAENVAEIATALGVPSISEFFGSELAKKLVKERGHPRLIIANNVMAHVPNLRDFILGLKILAGSNTVISIENPSLINLLEQNQFDTIYHEHFSYLTVYSVRKIASNLGLELFDVDQIEVHGGSNRYWLQLASRNTSNQMKLDKLAQDELESGLLDYSAWISFANRINTLISNLHRWLESAHLEGRRIYGYGAAAKASTLLNAALIQLNWLPLIADESSEKQGRFMPTTGIPIVSPQEMFAQRPTDVIVFPWNISKEIAEKIRESDNRIRIWRAVPRMEEVD